MLYEWLVNFLEVLVVLAGGLLAVGVGLSILWAVVVASEKYGPVATTVVGVVLVAAIASLGATILAHG